MFVGKGRFVDADKIRGQDIFQIAQPVLERKVVATRINGNHFSVKNGDTLDFGKSQLPQLIIPISHQVVRTGIAADKIFDLLSQRGRCVNNRYDFLLSIFVDNEFVFHRLKSLLFFHLPEETQHCNHRYQ